jgi:hypothetical protein
MSPIAFSSSQLIAIPLKTTYAYSHQQFGTEIAVHVEGEVNS